MSPSARFMARVVASSPRPTDSRNDATVNGNRYQLLGAGVWSIAPRSQVSARSCTSLSSWSHSHGRVSDRPSATDADSTIGWPCTWWSRISGHDSASSRPGVRVPAVRPCAYRSSQPCGSFPPAPATRKPAARNVRAKLEAVRADPGPGGAARQVEQGAPGCRPAPRGTEQPVGDGLPVRARVPGDRARLTVLFGQFERDGHARNASLSRRTGWAKPSPAAHRATSPTAVSARRSHSFPWEPARWG